MAIYLCGVLAGICCGYLILFTTIFKPARMTDSSVRVLGFRAPLGAFVAAWGGIAMLTSAPFDNWWHNAYGLDVKIVSPPHTLLTIGIWAVNFGALFLIVSAMNRADSVEFRRLQWLMLYLGGLMLVHLMLFCLEYTWHTHLHSSSAYISTAVGVPLLFAAIRICSRHRWAATLLATFYTVFIIGLILILPLFPAEPKLGPVYQHVTHFIPPSFPVLLLVPAILFDLLLTRGEKWNSWLVSLIAAPVFVLSLVAVEWPFADFLMSKAADNRFFGTGYLSYSVPPWSDDVLRKFSAPEHGLDLWKGLLTAIVYAAISTWLGLSLGRWMRKIQR